MSRVRTSLDRAMSSFTEEQVIERSRQQQRAAAEAGILLVHIRDDRLSWEQVEMVKMLMSKLTGTG